MKKLLLLSILLGQLTTYAQTPTENYPEDPASVKQGWAQTIVSGKVTDAKGEALVGASIQAVGTNFGAITDVYGAYSFPVTQKPPFKVTISFIGYDAQTFDVTTAATTLDIILQESAAALEEVIVSASRRAEKILNAPSSVSVISAKTLLAASASINPLRDLANVQGVQIQQQSATRMNIEMRGASGLFGTGVFPILDYRSLVSPGLGTFQSDASGLNSIDLQKIEIVRGPGSALYGPGVTTGVVHFISKSPIDYPGTTIELIGGQKATLGATARYAVASKDRKIGFKLNVSYKQGDEFTLDGNEGTTSAGVFTKQTAKFKTSVVDPIINDKGVVAADQSKAPVLLTKAQLDPDNDGNMMQNDWNNSTINGTLEWRPQSGIKAVLSGGTNTASSVFYNSQGEGLTNSTDYWTQARIQKGGFFAQVFYVNNNVGTSKKSTFLYQTGNNTILGRKQLEGQLQYNFYVPKILNANITVGADYRKAISDTKHRVYGRFEEEDDYVIMGAYAQGKYELSKKLDLVLAGRYDAFNFIDSKTFSPRAALVYKATPEHTFRTSYNIASSAPDGLTMYIDFPVSTPVAGLFDVWLKGLKTPQNFSANPMIDFTAPGFPDLPYGTQGLPLAIPYGAVTPNILTSLQAQLPANIFPLVRTILTDPANAPKGVSGKFTGYNLFTGLPLAPANVAPAQIRQEKSFEIGYKGVINKRLSISADWWRISTKGFTNFTAISPTIRYSDQNISNDLNASVKAMVTPKLEAALIAGGMPAAQAAATAAQIGIAVGGAYGQGGTAFAAQIAPLSPIFGAVETDGVPVDGMVHSAAGYRNFGKLSYWGTDISIGYALNADFNIFANLSAVNDNYFFEEEVGEAKGSGLLYALNIPKTKFRFGAIYAPDFGWRGNVSFQHDDAFEANLGQYSGTVAAKNIVDAGVGYKLKNGLSLDLACMNLFDSPYRAFVNFPQIGRRAIAKLIYTFGDTK